MGKCFSASSMNEAVALTEDSPHEEKFSVLYANMGSLKCFKSGNIGIYPRREWAGGVVRGRGG